MKQNEAKKQDKQVNTSKLSVGQVIKNYKELCELINEDITTGNAQKAQIKNLNRYIEFHKEGHKIIIDQIYDTPKAIEDKRSEGNNTIYGNYIQNLIMDLLIHNSQQHNERTLSFSTNRLLMTLDMINKNYMVGKRNIPDFSEKLKVEEDNLYEFFNTTHSNLQSALETALNNLKSEVYFSWYKKKMVCIEELELDMDDLGHVKITKAHTGRKQPSYTIKKIHRDATEAEEEIIMQCKDEILKKMKMNEKQVIAHRQWNFYIKRVNDLLNQRTNIVYFYDAYKLIINRNKVSNFAQICKQWCLSHEEKTMQKGELNALVMYNCDQNAHKRHSKAVEECKNKSAVEIEDHLALRSDPNYVPIYQMMIDAFIDNNTKYNCAVKN